MINIKKVAKKAVVLSELMNGREKIETEDIIKYYKDKISINAAECISIPDEKSEDGTSRFYVYTFKEEEKKFAFSGAVLTKVFDGIMEACKGDVEVFNKELADQVLEVRLSTGKTKDKKQITLVEVL